MDTMKQQQPQLQEHPTCANCGKHGDATMKQCSACKNANYCSVECQRTHWKSHKPRCQQLRRVKELVKEQQHKREYKLFQQWREKARDTGVLSYVLVNHIGTSRLAQLHQNMHIIRLGLDFDYNHRTFIPTKPKIVSPDTLGEKLANEMKDTYHMLLHKQAPVNALRFVALLQVNGIDGLTAAMPMIQEPSDTNLTKATWEEQCRLFHDIHLQSSKLTSWANIQQENVKLQIQNGIASNSAFQPFLVSALWIESNSSRHKTHIVVIKMEMGFGLGEIKHLDSFQVDPVADTILKMESNSNIPRAQVDYYKQHMFDLEHAPALLSSRVTHPNNALLPVVFWCPGYVFVLPNLIEIMPDHFVFATKKCDKKAREAFAKLQRVQLPRIKSPALH